MNEADETEGHDLAATTTTATALPAVGGGPPPRKRSQPLPSEGGRRTQGGSAWGRKTRTPRTTIEESIGGADVVAGYNVFLAPDLQLSPPSATHRMTAEDSDLVDSPPHDPVRNDPSLDGYGSEDEPSMSYSATKAKPVQSRAKGPHMFPSPSPVSHTVYASTRELLGYARMPARRLDDPDDEDLMAGVAAGSLALHSTLPPHAGGASQLPPWLLPPEPRLVCDLRGGWRDEGPPRSADPFDHGQLRGDMKRPSNIPGRQGYCPYPRQRVIEPTSDVCRPALYRTQGPWDVMSG